MKKIILEMGTMIRHKFIWNVKTSNEMVEEKPSGNFHQVVKSRHGFYPLNELINYDDDVLLTFFGGRSELHEVNAPFAEGVDRND